MPEQKVKKAGSIAEPAFVIRLKNRCLGAVEVRVCPFAAESDTLVCRVDPIDVRSFAVRLRNVDRERRAAFRTLDVIVVEITALAVRRRLRGADRPGLTRAIGHYVALNNSGADAHDRRMLLHRRRERHRRKKY